MTRGVPWLLSLALTASGCSVLYDPDRLSGDGDASVDGAAPATLTAIEPGVLEEGAGSGGSRPAVVRVLGSGLRGAAFTMSWQGGGPAQGLEIVDREVSVDGRSAVLALTLPVDPSFDNGVRTLVLSIDESVNAPNVTTPVAMLPELSIPSMTPVPPFVYSRIVVETETHVPGGLPPLVLRSTSSIVVEARLDVDAAEDVGGRAACVAGPTCPGAGRPGVGGFGGGGGGFGTMGAQGQNLGQGGQGGPAVGTRMLVPLGEEGNRGQPGGIGFHGAVGDAAGGGGGGAMILWAEGDVTIGAKGALSAGGGAGRAGASASGGGGGGGGSGGAILIHAGGMLRAITGSIDCQGGEGGRDAIVGGPGGVGRVRIDAATLAGVPGPLVDDLVLSGAPYRGASFAIETPLVVTAATLDVQVVGPPQEMLVLDVPGGTRTVMTDAAGSARFMAVPLPPGLHRLCVTVAGTPLDPFGRSCIDLAAP